MQHEYMKPCEYNNILTGLIITLSGLKERRPSAGRRLLVQSIIADIDELCTMLKNEIFERVNREIWLEADEGIDYAALAEQLQTLQPVELVKSSGDEDDIIGNLNRVVEALADLLFGIADALDRHHSNEDYLKLYEDQMKLFFRLRYKNSAIQSYRRWCEKDCLGSPTIEDLEEYRSLLDLSGTGVMGYITIKSIGVYIPIYHGTEESVLQIAVGHLDWTSLPVGGESTHTVLSGHRGLPSAKLFTDLDQIKEGDQFSITVLNQMISYEVDQIRIVEPGDISELSIVPGQDYCTLVTCTPYGINTHRMLVRGHRVANESGDLVVTPEAYRIPNYLTIPAVAIPLLFLFLIGMLIYYRISNAKMKKNDVYRLIEEVTEEKPSDEKRKKPAGKRRKE